ncbi:hypothetical protein ACP3V3_16995 [Vibrio sp. PNB22_3_1]
MEYKIIVLCESMGGIQADTEEIQDDFTEKFIELFGSEALATKAVLHALSDSEWVNNECYVSEPWFCDNIREQYFEASEYAFRDWVFGRPDELAISIGIGRE